ncbi:MAG: peptidase S10 [Alphaproteobacteria bacterium]|nr:peptidase S10 [Alphaproteobacteria bacterium]MBU1516743.1 peptidase S10 [Alphaproteobacteria bacterium]MBU2092437.1 peptidase S10 [Alphaproteobacteria bacterium]MBU2152709.1 peptidase S10 [Alphaproteobacteria bacterium]MBU2305643.1 peptidase S10 [Alphaproteobacteria bacterium]
MTTWRNGGLAALGFAMLAAAPLPAAAQAPTTPAAGAARVPRVAVTRHEGTFNGQTLRYTSTVAETFLNDAAGHPVASATTIAYVRDGVKDRARRPVMFLFNGGPGASSSPLHMSALGPYKRTPSAPGDRSGGGWVENPTSPLDAVDLVFIDPVGTGFSRPFPGVDGKAFYSNSGDAQSVKTVIQVWLKTNGREASPRYLAGESYGTTRAASIVKISQDLPFDGVLLVALAGDVPGREMPYVVALPTMAAGAWYHQKIDRAGRTVDQVFAEALQFARTDYVTALIQGASLPPAEKRRVAERMSALVGLPAALIEAKDLRLSKNDWMFNILKDKTLRTGLLDVTITAPLEPGQDGAIDDPALGVVPKRAAGAPAGPPPSPAALGAIPSPVVGRYLNEVLKYPATDPYYGVNFAVNAAWTHERGSNPYEALGAAMRENPKMRLFWAAGYYDLTTPAYSGRYVLDQAGVPGGQLTAAYFAGPHGVYDHPENLARFDAAVRDFVTAP